MQKIEFSKLLIVADYATFFYLVNLQATHPEVDMTAIIATWAVQLGTSTGVYYWKAKAENRIKITMKLIKQLPEELLNGLNITDIIKEVIGHDERN